MCATLLTVKRYFEQHMRPSPISTARDSYPGVQRSGLWKSAIWLLLAAQLFLAAGPVFEGQFGADARPHVEIAGTNAHHAHNPADCATCAARALFAVPNRVTSSNVVSLRPTAPALPERDEYLDFLRESDSLPRAPPLRQA